MDGPQHNYRASNADRKNQIVNAAFRAYSTHIAATHRRAQMTTINIKGQDFKIVGVRSFEYKGEQRKELSLRKPKGRRTYFAVVYANGSMSEVV